jgi:hypothetical protein
MVLLVLLPVYGSWLNQDFAALQPLHGHIFLEGFKPDHHPPGFQHPGGHGETVEADGVVNIPGQDAAGLGLLILFFVGVAVVVLPGRENGLKFAFTAHYTLLKGIFPEPLEQPPR